MRTFREKMAESIFFHATTNRTYRAKQYTRTHTIRALIQKAIECAHNRRVGFLTSLFSFHTHTHTGTYTYTIATGSRGFFLFFAKLTPDHPEHRHSPTPSLLTGQLCTEITGHCSTILLLFQLQKEGE